MAGIVEIYHETIFVIKQMVEDVRFNREVQSQNIKEQAEKIKNLVLEESNLFHLIDQLKEVELYFYTHPIDVAIISSMLGKWLKLGEDDIYQLACAGLIHDIGKAKIPNSLLNKKFTLNEEDLEIFQKHTLKGYEILKAKDEWQEGVLLAVLQHHERQDGKGYPSGLEGNETHQFAKIVGIADMFDAMRSERSFTAKRPMYHVIKEITEGSYGNLDPMVSQCFLTNIVNGLVGSQVLLSNGMTGKVIYVNPTMPSRPMVQTEQNIIDLSREKDIEIVDIV
ncbi:hypothetical protein BHU72_13445 [Desulfuribacillus stibiiarsenatis]|uniref:HD-GYP domain-containing protein n=1 Tax=Desulfuribacillus stibiiarsenatis TaxID=1390249 RepID=A0A1E5L8D0_9FIRM|nr:HD-GYP domain-containing protein [Desulfuribacillus stibiiarsenatis]OEH86417.1 hypothetical protein BHU72_13445 [Desulfuribacillus stibiiarsenatis]